MEKRKFRMPTAYTILFLLIILVAAATWLIPAGAYDYVDGVPQAGTYHPADPSPQGIGAVLKAAFSGFYDAVDVCVFILMVGGFLGVVMKTGAVDAGVGSIIRHLGGKEKWLIPILMLLFGLGGTTYGMWEETMAFYPLLIPVFLAAGYARWWAFRLYSLARARESSAPRSTHLPPGSRQALRGCLWARGFSCGFCNG